jgi:alkaline phosphatase
VIDVKRDYLKISTIAFLIVMSLFVVGLPSAGKPENPGKPGKPGKTPKNVILLIGDGMGFGHINLTRLAVNGGLAMDTLDYGGEMTTYMADLEVTDSAAAATAIATGTKTYDGYVSMLPDGTVLETVLERAKAVGKATGLITDVTIHHATPAAFATHAQNRYMKLEITQQLFEGDVDVMLAGGWSYWVPQDWQLSSRPDDLNLIQEKVDAGWTYVGTRDELNNLDTDGVDKLLGLFNFWEFSYNLDMEEEGRMDVEPLLPEMTEKAIEVLSQDRDGFFLMIEGGMIDWSAEARDAPGVIAEAADFDAAVQVALDFAKGDKNTLVVVAADHESGGLDIDGDEEKGFLNNVEVTADHMWGQITQGTITINDALKEYANIKKLTHDEKILINTYGELGISAVISERANVVWGFSGSQEGEHTNRTVPVFATGPTAEQFVLSVEDNTDLGYQLFIAVSGNPPPEYD